MYIAGKRSAALAESDSSGVPLAHAVTVNVLDRYQQSDLYQENHQQLQKTMDVLLEREQMGEEGRVKTATYATNVLWQVST